MNINTPDTFHRTISDPQLVKELGDKVEAIREVEEKRAAMPTDPRTGRKLMTPKVVDYDINQAPPIVKALVEGVRAMTDEALQREAVNQFPREFPVRIPQGFPTPEPTLVWVGKRCGITTVYNPVGDGHTDPEDRYKVGDEEDCLECDSESCADACMCVLRRHLPYFTKDDTDRARRKLEGYVVGLALGVTKLEADPVTVPVRAAFNLDRDVAERQAKERHQKRQAMLLKEQRRAKNRDRAAKAKAARKAGR